MFLWFCCCPQRQHCSSLRVHSYRGTYFDGEYDQFVLDWKGHVEVALTRNSTRRVNQRPQARRHDSMATSMQLHSRTEARRPHAVLLCGHGRANTLRLTLLCVSCRFSRRFKTTWQLVKHVQKKFEDRIIFMSMFNDIDWIEKRNSEKGSRITQEGSSLDIGHSSVQEKKKNCMEHTMTNLKESGILLPMSR